METGKGMSVENLEKTKMSTLRLKKLARRAGWTLTELMVAMSISTMLSAGLITAIISLQRSFLASRHHIVAQSEQMLLLDFMGLDLRRALSVTTSATELTITIPDYYQTVAGKEVARDPAIQGSQAVYGPTPKTIRYYKTGTVIYRNEAGVPAALATNVSEFQMIFQNLGQSINVTITFAPKYQLWGRDTAARRASTTTYTSTLLRNKR